MTSERFHPRPFHVLIALLPLAAGCRDEPPPNPSVNTSTKPNGIPAKPPRAITPRATGPIVFRTQTLPFQFDRGESGVALPVEVTGGGVAVLDYDDDGDLDLFFAQGVPLQPNASTDQPETPPSVLRGDVLLRNDGADRWTDVSAGVGLHRLGYGQGVAVADYDGDGDVDIYVTRFGKNTLWRNDRHRFTDATAQAGVGCELWSLGAAFADFDGDGDLDLYVANYFDFDPSHAPFARDELSSAPEYGAPSSFLGQPDLLYRNEGDGTFQNVSIAAGIVDHARGMGVLAADFDRDGHVDFLVANDAEANILWRNRGDGAFENVADAWGIATNAEGRAEANMGIGHGDTNGDGFLDIIITHFEGEHDTLWTLNPPVAKARNPVFIDESKAAGIAVDSKPTTGWGVAIADFDLDGHPDIITTNGHLRRERRSRFLYENPPLLWRGRPDGRFENVGEQSGLYGQSTHLGRGLAVGDLDRDGDLDVVIVHHHKPSVILWNDSPRKGRWFALDLKSTKPGGDCIGAWVRVVAGDRAWVQSCDSGGSYISSNATTLNFGLGETKIIDRVEIHWPDAAVEVRTNVMPDTRLRIVQTKTRLSAPTPAP